MAMKRVASGAKTRGAFNSDLAQVWIGIAMIVLTGFGPLVLGNSYWVHTFQLVNIYIAVAIFQNFLFVDAGQKSFGQGAILGLAAYTAAVMYGLHGWSIPAAGLAGLVASALGGLLFALPAMRVQGFHLGFVTMSAAIVFPQLLVTLDRYTNGINGINVTMPSITEPGAFGLSVLQVAVVVVPIAALLLHYWLRRSKLGRAMFVAALSPEAARTLGIRPGFMRFLAL